MVTTFLFISRFFLAELLSSCYDTFQTKIKEYSFVMVYMFDHVAFEMLCIINLL